MKRQRPLGASGSAIDDGGKRLDELKLRLTPHFVDASPPQEYKDRELQAELRKRLTPRQFQLAIDPLLSTSDMKKWAWQLVGDATEDMKKGKRLFLGLTRHINLGQAGEGRRTAKEVFESWHNAEAEFTCQEYIFLYVALARSVGLGANFTFVDADYHGKVRPHACAVVFINGKGILVDPAYRWFGIPHARFRVQSDLQVIGSYLAQLDDVEKGETAVKLVPEEPLAHFNLAIVLASEGRLAEARERLEAGLKLDSGGWMASLAQGMVAARGEKWDSAATHLRKCLELNPDYTQARFFLAKTLFSQGKLTEAREEYRAYLQGENEPSLAEEARGAISAINETLP